MTSGDLWWARTTVKQTNSSASGAPGFGWKFVPTGIEFAGAVVGAPVWPLAYEWSVEVRADYFLDPARMPATGEPFISLPKMVFEGGLGLAPGLDEKTAGGDARCSVSFRQVLRWDDDEVASSDVLWPMGYVRGKSVLSGKKRLTPQQRDYGALFFNLDRTRTLNVSLVTTFHFSVLVGGVIGFAPLVLQIPPWKVYSLD
jgi:hypothetical protein